MASDLGESIEKIRNAESGRTKLSVEIAIKIEKIYGVDFKWLLTGEGEMFRTATRGEEWQVGSKEEAKIRAIKPEPQVCQTCGQAHGLEKQVATLNALVHSKNTIIRQGQEMLQMKNEEIGRLKEEIKKQVEEVATLEQLAQEKKA